MVRHYKGRRCKIDPDPPLQWSLSGPSGQTFLYLASHTVCVLHSMGQTTARAKYLQPGGPAKYLPVQTQSRHPYSEQDDSFPSVDMILMMGHIPRHVPDSFSSPTTCRMRYIGSGRVHTQDICNLYLT